MCASSCKLCFKTFSHRDLASLMDGHCHLPLPFKSEADHESACSHLPVQLSVLIDTLKLQDDIVEFSIAGMPLIESSSISSLRIPFIFKEDRSRPSLNVTLVHCYLYTQISESCSIIFNRLRDHAMDLEGVAAKLPDKFKV